MVYCMEQNQNSAPMDQWLGHVKQRARSDLGSRGAAEPIVFQTGPYSKSRRRSLPSLREAVRRVSMMIGPLARVLFDLSSSRFSGPRRGIQSSAEHEKRRDDPRSEVTE